MTADSRGAFIELIFSLCRKRARARRHALQSLLEHLVTATDEALREGISLFTPSTYTASSATAVRIRAFPYCTLVDARKLSDFAIIEVCIC